MHPLVFILMNYMKKVKKNLCFTFLLFCFFIAFKVEAQLPALSILDNYMQKSRIGLVDEFFDRFNGNVSHPDILTDAENNRLSNMLMLFELSRFVDNDSLFHEATMMMNVAINDSVKINYEDETWLAKAYCKGKLYGKDVSFDLYLNVQSRGNDMYKWVINKAEGEIFDITTENTSDKIMLHPDDHEINFMSLNRLTSEQPHDIKLFMTKDFNYSPTSTFVYLIYSGKLKIDYVEDLKFIFTQIPGYIFSVKYFSRDTNNAGWLISDFYKINNEDKKDFLDVFFPRPLINSELSCIEKISNDNVLPDSLKHIYYKRALEEYAIVYDFLADLSIVKHKDVKTAICKKLKSYINEDAVVTVINFNDGTTSQMTLDNFFNTLKKGKLVFRKFSSLRKISFPIWNEELFAKNMDQDNFTCDSFECNLPLELYDIFENDVIPQSCGQKGLVRVEKTLDGFEFVPYIGNITVILFDKNDKNNFK